MIIIKEKNYIWTKNKNENKKRTRAWVLGENRTETIFSFCLALNMKCKMPLLNRKFKARSSLAMDTLIYTGSNIVTHYTLHEHTHTHTQTHNNRIIYENFYSEN